MALAGPGDPVVNWMWSPRSRTERFQFKDDIWHKAVVFNLDQKHFPFIRFDNSDFSTLQFNKYNQQILLNKISSGLLLLCFQDMCRFRCFFCSCSPPFWTTNYFFFVKNINFQLFVNRLDAGLARFHATVLHKIRGSIKPDVKIPLIFYISLRFLEIMCILVRGGC